MVSWLLGVMLNKSRRCFSNRIKWALIKCHFYEQTPLENNKWPMNDEAIDRDARARGLTYIVLLALQTNSYLPSRPIVTYHYQSRQHPTT